MKLVSYLKEEQDQVAILTNGLLFNLEFIHPDLPNNMSLLLNYWEEVYPMMQAGLIMIEEGKIAMKKGISYEEVTLMAPVPYPTSCRDAYAFRKHVLAARRNRNLDMIPEFDQYPVFYFTNHHAIKGPGPISCMPDHFRKLDFELEAAIVICKHGKNIRADQADHYIAGLMIMNDFSARQLQMDEMKLNLGPAKGKDFATSLGPWLVTVDDLASFEVPARHGHVGKAWNLNMSCSVNGNKISDCQLSEMDWTFAEIIERASYGVDLYPGDIIGSGTAATGCFLELNGTAKLKDTNFQERWLQEGDVIELEIEQLGKLSNTIIAEKEDWRILK
ncbi:MAG: fumarylacetoacetate hydrolase family protein [Flavisolibacter sp.]